MAQKSRRSGWISGHGWSAPGCGRWLEVVAEAELHAAGQILHGAVDAKVFLCKPLPQGHPVRVEAHAVGDVEDLPRELESTVLFELPGLGQSRIDAKGAVATEVVTFSN